MIRHLFAASLACVLVGCVKPRTPVEVLIPEGYTGWVRVEYGSADAPALSVEYGRYVIRVPHAGILRTSTPFETGFADDRYYYVTANGQRTELKEAAQPDDDTGTIRGRKMFAKGVPGQRERTFGAFFVGPLSAYRSAPKEPGSLPLP